MRKPNPIHGHHDIRIPLEAGGYFVITQVEEPERKSRTISDTLKQVFEKTKDIPAKHDKSWTK